MAQRKKDDTKFDFAGTPGPMCPMQNELRHVVRCCTWPESLLDMYQAGMLKGDAYEYAAQLAKTAAVESREEGSLSAGPIQPDAEAVPDD